MIASGSPVCSCAASISSNAALQTPGLRIAKQPKSRGEWWCCPAGFYEFSDDLNGPQQIGREVRLPQARMAVLTRQRDLGSIPRRVEDPRSPRSLAPFPIGAHASRLESFDGNKIAPRSIAPPPLGASSQRRQIDTNKQKLEDGTFWISGCCRITPTLLKIYSSMRCTTQ